ncbi:ABC transporter ATP-binding protein [Salinigranum halophilum]|uniref:ABC transporter ATP-binding protein n=1 Tax=Salinigranum halophilum TaxID=2565931 RepID=UPI001F455A01|nr:ABC transporter ATP-binding protein [Salinigranum halophilum]
MGFILPIIEIAQGSGEQSANGLVGYFLRVYDFVGIPFTLGYVTLGVGLVIGVRYTVGFFVNWFAAILRLRYVEDLRREAFTNALGARVGYFDQEGSDEILNSIITQTQYAGEATSHFVRIVELSTTTLAYVLLALYLSPTLTLTTAVVVGGLMYGVRAFLESGYEVGERVANANEQVQESVQAGMQGIRDVKLFNMNGELYKQFEKSITNYSQSMITQSRNQGLINNANQFLTAGAVFGLIYVGLEIASLSLSSLGLFLFVMFRLGPKVSNLNDLIYKMENTLPHLVRTQQFVAKIEDQHEYDGSKSPSKSVEHVAFEDVHFAYDLEEEKVLNGLSFAMDRGEFVAFVGPSGAGKSTVVSLLARMYEPSSGEITADGTPIDQFDIQEWRSRISVVRQNPFIFNETLRYNLTVGNRDATGAEIDRMCRIAKVDEFLDDLPDGYDTMVGDDGVRLSGGQKQRVAIARALLKDADFLVLDEATSDLDSHLELEVHRGIEALDRDYGIIAIAHRLSTITDADRIYMMENGSIVEEGPHPQLVDHDGQYADLYMTQVQS